MNIDDALRHPKLFGGQFDDPSWAPWRSFLKALFALEMDEVDLATFTACTGRNLPPTAAFSEAVAIVGRRGGKSRILALVAVYLAAFRDHTPHLAPGEVATIAVIASTRSQARSIFRFVSGLLEAVPLLRTLIADETGEVITLSNRVNIEIATASFRGTRGSTYAGILCDEIAFWRQDESSANPDVEILRALRPGLSTIPGAVLLLASSPYAKRGELYAAFRRHYGVEGARVLVWKASTETMNSKVDKAIIREAYETDPESARAEYGAEFRDDLADFVTREIVDSVTAWGRSELPPEPGITYAAFVDPSGGIADSMTLAIGHLGTNGVGILDVVREARAPFDPEKVVVEFAALLRRYGISRITGDKFGGLWPRQRFAESGIQYEASARPKSDLYLDLLSLLNAQRVELLEHPRLSAQLVGLERRTARSGKDSVDHSPGGHDDIANVAAGVLTQLDLDRRPALVAASDLREHGEALAMPVAPDCVYSVSAVGKDGMCATVFCARTRGRSLPPLVLIDFSVMPMVGSIWRTIAGRLDELAKETRATRGVLCAFVPAPLLQTAFASGLRACECPVVDVDALQVSATAYLSSGVVKLTQAVEDKARGSPFAAALSFRAGEDENNPLRMAILMATALAFDGAPLRLKASLDTVGH